MGAGLPRDPPQTNADCKKIFSEIFAFGRRSQRSRIFSLFFSDYMLIYFYLDIGMSRLCLPPLFLFGQCPLWPLHALLWSAEGEEEEEEGG